MYSSSRYTRCSRISYSTIIRANIYTLCTNIRTSIKYADFKQNNCDRTQSPRVNAAGRSQFYPVTDLFYCVKTKKIFSYERTGQGPSRIAFGMEKSICRTEFDKKKKQKKNQKTL